MAHVVTAVAVYFLSAKFGLIGIKPWIAAAHSVVALPVVLVILQSALETVDPNLERAAMVCGCTRFSVFRRMVVPLALTLDWLVRRLRDRKAVHAH